MGRWLPEKGLPAYLIAQMRFGKYGSVQSQPYMQRLEECLDAEERARLAPPPASLTEPTEPAMKLRDRAPASRNDEGEPLSKLRQELGTQCENARTATQLSELGSKIGAMAARGEIPIALMRALHENISRREQLLADERLEAERASAGQETIIRITYVNNWTGGPLPAGIEAGP